MKPAIALLALAVVVLAARRQKRSEPPIPQADDSEVVGMPTTWSAEQDNATTIGPRRVVHGLPTF